jgi:hypothetical protein
VGFDFLFFWLFGFSSATRGDGACGLVFLCLREAVFCCARCLVYLALRWHPRGGVCCTSRFGFFAFARRGLLRTRFGCFAFALASAPCLRASSVAPVRGGTYFSLPPCMDRGHG